MGKGNTYHCKKYGHSYSVFPGAGFLYPEEYRSVIAEIAEGLHAEERKVLYEQTPFAAVGAEKAV